MQENLQDSNDEEFDKYTFNLSAMSEDEFAEYLKKKYEKGQDNGRTV